jgi:hypothetical protein
MKRRISRPAFSVALFLVENNTNREKERACHMQEDDERRRRGEHENR